MRIISSQRYRDDAIVEAKREKSDFSVFVSPVFVFDDEEIRVVLDGHHSLEAAKDAEAEPEYIEMDARDHDAIALLNRGDVENFLAVTHMGDDYYDVKTGDLIW